MICWIDDIYTHIGVKVHVFQHVVAVSTRCARHVEVKRIIVLQKDLSLVVQLLQLVKENGSRF